MEVIVLESEAFKKLHSDIMQKMHQVVREAREEALRTVDPADNWITVEEAQKILGLKGKYKLQELRDLGEITCSKSKRTIVYCKKSILDFIERNIEGF